MAPQVRRVRPLDRRQAAAAQRRQGQLAARQSGRGQAPLPRLQHRLPGQPERVRRSHATRRAARQLAGMGNGHLEVIHERLDRFHCQIQ